MKLVYFFPLPAEYLILGYNVRVTILIINQMSTNANKPFLRIFSLISLFFQILLKYIHFINIYSTLTYIFMSSSHTWATYQNVKQPTLYHVVSRLYSRCVVCEATKLGLSLSYPEKGHRGLRTRRQGTLPESQLLLFAPNSPGSSQEVTV